MAQFKDEWLEHQRRRFMRPDAHRWMRPDTAKSQGATEAPDAKSDAELHGRRLAVATLRLEWELLKFSLRGRKAGFNPAQPRDDHGRWTNGGGGSDPQDSNTTDGKVILAASRGGGIKQLLDKVSEWTVRQFISYYCRGQINREIPGQFDDVTIAELLDRANRGDEAAKKCYKILNQQRFRK
jgi:hypothetical protein